MRGRRIDLDEEGVTIGVVDAHEDVGVELGLVVLVLGVDAGVLSSGGHMTN